jgi:hypothetical protein
MGGSLKTPAGEFQWAWLACQQAQIMVTRASEAVIPRQQAVLFYLYSPNLIELRDHLLANRVLVSEISYPEYMPKGEIRVDDPDGYCLLIGQAG